MMARYRLIALGTFFLLGFSVVLFRAAKLQLLPPDQVEKISERQLNHKIEIVGRRGVITDRHGRELSVSTNSLSVFANPKLVTNPGRTARELSKVLSLNESEILFKLRSSSERKFIWLERQLSKKNLEKLKALDLAKLPGVGVLPEFRREYPQGTLAAHVLGFVSVDGKGLEGIERQFNEELQGVTQTLSIGRDALGRPLMTHKDQIQLDQNQGSRIELTIDARLQHFAESAIKATVEKHKAEGGSIVVIDPFNGEVLALANHPTFDPNRVRFFPQAFRRNRSLSDPIEPGSVMKPFVVAKALEDKIVTPQSILQTGGGFIKVKNKVIGESDAKHRFEQLSILDIIRVSSNVGMVVLKDKMGFDRVDEVYRDLGFMEKTGIELSGESRGIYKKPNSKQLVEQATISFGQGISLTPLQIASGYAVLANGGSKVQPHLIRRIHASSEGSSNSINLEREIRSIELKRRVFSKATSEKMRKILETVVSSEGTGVAAKVEGFQAAGKTGTSQRVDFEKGGYEAGSYWSLFSGFIPSENPRYVITVIVDKPTENGFYGAQVAAPTFAKFASNAIRMGQMTVRPRTR